MFYFAKDQSAFMRNAFDLGSCNSVQYHMAIKIDSTMKLYGHEQYINTFIILSSDLICLYAEVLYSDSRQNFY